MSEWARQDPKRAALAEEGAKARRALYAAEAEVTRLRAHVERLEIQLARAVRENRDAVATIERMIAAREG